MNWKESALNHAKEQDPKESCGLLLNIRGKERYYPCKNLAETSYQSFILDPTDYVKATKKGEIIGVVHSHPSTPPIASQADMVSCEKENYKWYIVNPKTEQWGYYEPCGYKAPLLGREWVWGVTDCWSLVRDYYNEVLGIELIDFDRTMTPDEFIKNPLFVSCAEKTGFRRLNPDEPLMENDVLCMNMVGNGLHHVALFTKGEVLHHLTDRLSCREPYSAWLQKCTGAKYRYDN